MLKVNSVLPPHPLGFGRDGGTERYWPVWAGRPVSVISPSFFFLVRQALHHLMSISLNGFFRLLRHRLFPLQFSLLLLVFGFGRHSYRARELFISWLFFCLLFVILALAVVAALLAFHAGRYLFQRLRPSGSVPPLPPHAAELEPLFHSPPPL